MKKILGLDLGTTSIGWALVKEAEKSEEKSEIIKLGVRVVPLTTDEQGNFEKGKAISTNADRTLKRSMRRNLQRYKLRRDELISLMKSEGWINDQSVLAEDGKETTHETLKLRATAAQSEISLEEFARVLLTINKKRGYKSSRKLKSEEDGAIIDGMEIAKKLYIDNLTPGEYVCDIISAGKYNIPDFYRSDLQAEFDKVWEKQREFYPTILTDELKESLKEKNKTQTWAICQKPFNIVGIQRKEKGKELTKENYRLRTVALKEKIGLEELAIVLQEINGQLKNSSGYLGAISDRSKELYFNNLTVGQFLFNRIRISRHNSLKNIVFYRQDYMDEFERIWETQKRYHPELRDSIKREIRDIIIFYQRRLRSQKGLVSICEFENREVEVDVNGKKTTKRVGLKVCPKSSPLFQEFKIWQILNNLKVNGIPMDQESKDDLFVELSTKGKMSSKEILKLLYPRDHKNLQLNYKDVEGDNTQSELFKAYAKIIEESGNGELDFKKQTAYQLINNVSEIFEGLGWKTDFLYFNSYLDGKEFENQPLFKLWHLIYSFEGDNSISGNEKLKEKISQLTGIPVEYAKHIANISLTPDYSSLSSKAIKKILNWMSQGYEYSEACELAGYRHSKSSLTREEIDAKIYKDKLSLLPKNSLRNPVVEKILNQMVNVVNAVIDQYGKPDEIRIELARELKKSAKERENATTAVRKANDEHSKIVKILKEDFNMENPSRKDIIKYKLYEELKDNGYKTLYSNTYIQKEELFSHKFDIEHIIPQANFFDDSFGNKTIETSDVNKKKSNKTAYDYVLDEHGAEGVNRYEATIKMLYDNNCISKKKYNHLMMKGNEIPEGFIERDLRESQYIAKKAKEMLNEVVKSVVSTTGSVTDRLREDWQLVDLMKELNFDKYDKVGMTYIKEDNDGRKIKKLIDWTKRNDHRHHAMDALTIAFTKPSFIQYLNNLNARINKDPKDLQDFNLSDYSLRDITKEDWSKVVWAIERSQLYRDSKHKLRFIPPMPLDEFRSEAKKHLSSVLVSIKSKNKVTTRNINVTKCKGGNKKCVQFTPRGQMHNETVYGKVKLPVIKEEKIGSTFDLEKINTITNPVYREALRKKLAEYNNDPKKAFTGSNSLEKRPLYLNEMHTLMVPPIVKTLTYDEVTTIRKPITKDLKIEKVLDAHIREILKERLEEYDGDANKAFSNLDNNPIWLNKEKSIVLKRVTIKDPNTVVALHSKHDHKGNLICDKDGRSLGSDFVAPGNNHHIAIYIDSKGELQENLVTFFDAVSRANLKLPIIDREYRKDDGWKFLFTMKRNEYFVFPNNNTGFDPNEIDLTDPANYDVISPNLFRVQKLSSKYYSFRHHLETRVDNESPELRDITWKRINTINKLKGVVKVRVDHLGNIVQIGE